MLREKTADPQFCSHCPGLSQVRYGDPTRIEDQQLRVAKIRAEIYYSKSARNS
jgi:hypothetical protein